jgi:acyl carrier protein
LSRLAPPQWDERFERILRANLRALASEDALRPDDSLYGLGLDSVSTIEIVVAVEDDYGVELGDESLGRDVFATPARLWAALVAAHPHIIEVQTGRRDGA